jgi:sugar lactone lactonase YvrE
VDDEGNVYVLDSQLSQVNVYTDAGEYLNTIGNEGEGPGEFKQPSGMFLTEEGNVAVVQTHPGKIVLLSPEGDPLGEHPIPKSEDGGFILLLKGYSGGGNTVLMARQDEYTQGFTANYFLASLDTDGNELTRYCTSQRTIDLTTKSMNDSDWDTIDRRVAVDKNGKVYACTDYQDYRIKVWNSDGSMDRVIEREYTHRKRTTEEKEEIQSIMDVFVKRFGLSVNIHDWNKDIETLYVRDDGSIWVLNSNGQRDKPEGTIGMFDVFDSKGRFVREITLEGEGDPKTDGYFFVGSRVYVVTDLLQAAIAMQGGGESADLGDEEPEPMAVICYKIDGDVLTSNR